MKSFLIPSLREELWKRREQLFFGEIQSWFDSYIKFNGYGNLESLSEYQAAELAGCYQREIYDWDRYEDYIDMDEYDYPEEEEEEEEEDDL